MSEGDLSPRLKLRSAAIGLLLFVAILVAAVVVRALLPERRNAPAKPVSAPAARPIVEIVRSQAGLPDLSPLVSRLCPSIAAIASHDHDPQPNVGDGVALAAASVYSDDGWLVTSATGLPAGPIDALFGDGRRAAVTDERTDPVSGLVVVRVDGDVQPLGYSDQAFPQVGQFGLVVETPRGAGCSAAPAMIGSDFIADGAGSSGYVRLQPSPATWAPGMPLVGSDGLVIGIGGGTGGMVIPAAIASVVVDELIRNSPSPSVAFGFRAVDFAAPVPERLGNVRSGAAIALVQAKSDAARAGLHAGDIVVAIGDDPVSSASELNRILDAAKGKVKLTVQRGADNRSVVLRRSGGS